MDSDLIYAKTASGEEAMYQRTRVMQRNLRMILILVDGQSTVADLYLKTGNRQLTESALSDLEKGGFIELQVEQDSIWAESKKVAQEIRAAAIDKALRFSRNKDSSRSSVPSLSEPPLSMHSVFNELPRNDSLNSQFSLAPGVHKRPSSGKSVSSGEKQAQLGRRKTRISNSRQSPLSLLERLKVFVPGWGQAGSDVSIKPIRRGSRQSMGWPVMMMYGVLGILALAFLLINFFPFERYVSDVEAVLSRTSGLPVKVGTMQVNAYPSPGLILRDVRIGAGKDSIRVAEIRLQPGLFSLMGSKTIFREAVLSGVSLSSDLVVGLPHFIAEMTRPDSKMAVDHLRFEKVEASFGNLALAEMEGEVRLSSSGLFQSLALWSFDHSVNLELKPQGRRIDVILEGIGWRPTQNSPVLIDSIKMGGSIDHDAFSINDLELHIFDGALRARGVAVKNANNILSLSGDLSFERINAARLGEALGIGSQFSGESSGKLSFSTIADSGSSIYSNISGDGDFSIRHGSVREIDLVETVRRATASPVLGGSTSFEQITGKIKLTPTSSLFSGLILSSGLMQSTGLLEVSKNLEVRGQMDLQMRGSVNQTHVPIAIKGPLKAPALQLAIAK